MEKVNTKDKNNKNKTTTPTKSEVSDLSAKKSPSAKEKISEQKEIETQTTTATNAPAEYTTNESYFSSQKFSEFPLSEETLRSLSELSYETATEIQSKCIPLGLEGRDIIGNAKTGSGKSLAFLIPAIEHLIKTRPEDGINCTRALVLTPTRELALQLYNIAKDLLTYHSDLNCALIMGGANRRVESEKLKKGVSLIIACPGRFLDHLVNTKGFDATNISMLIIDEADDILKIGFEKELREILSLLPKSRQTMLFSATISPKVEDLITLSVKNYEFVGIKSKEATVSTLEQGFVMTEPDKKFRFLFTFLRNNLNKKIMVFFSTIKAVEFYSYLLNYVDTPCMSIHGDQKQQKRSTTYLEFCNLEKGILLCTDVAQRGLDIPDVDWVIQYDPPHDPQEYLHRVGRTARGAKSKGKALLVLLPCEVGMIRYLKSNKININEFQFDEKKLRNVQDQLEKLVQNNHYLYTSSVDAYRSFLHSYVAHTLKDVYDINNLDLAKVCRSFGLTSPPFVNLNVGFMTQSMKRKKLKGKDAFYNKVSGICDKYYFFIFFKPFFNFL
jgi:ATP-dependent RNA helicase DDX18/HAS1